MIRTVVQKVRKGSLFRRCRSISRFMCLFHVSRLFSRSSADAERRQASPRFSSNHWLCDVIQNNWDYKYCQTRIEHARSFHLQLWRNCCAGVMTGIQVSRQVKAGQILRCALSLRPQASRFLCVPSCFIQYKMPSILTRQFHHSRLPFIVQPGSATFTNEHSLS